MKCWGCLSLPPQERGFRRDGPDAQALFCSVFRAFRESSGESYSHLCAATGSLRVAEASRAGGREAEGEGTLSSPVGCPGFGSGSRERQEGQSVREAEGGGLVPGTAVGRELGCRQRWRAGPGGQLDSPWGVELGLGLGSGVLGRALWQLRSWMAVSHSHDLPLPGSSLGAGPPLPSQPTAPPQTKQPFSFRALAPF